MLKLMIGAQPISERAEHIVVGPRVLYGVDNAARDVQIGVTATAVQVVMFRKVVAGSTTSAYAAVSVINCSCTQTKRSSRKTFRTRAESGATTAGLCFG